MPSAWGHPCGAELGCCSSCVTFEHNTQTALAGINCPQRAAVCVQCVRLRGCLAHMKLIRAVEWYRTRASFSLVNNLCPAFTASFSQAEVEAKRAEQWDIETNCAEGDSEHTWEDVLSCRGALGNPAKAGVFVGNAQEKLFHPRGCCKMGPADRVVWCSSGKALKWLLLPGVPWLAAFLGRIIVWSYSIRTVCDLKDPSSSLGAFVAVPGPCPGSGWSWEPPASLTM